MKTGFSQRAMRPVPQCHIQILSPKDVVLERRAKSLGILTLSRLNTETDGSWSEQVKGMERLGDTIDRDNVNVRQYDGRLRSGGNVLVRVYPRSNSHYDSLAANELEMHSRLQNGDSSKHVVRLIGAYETDDAQCLVFERRGRRIALTEYIQMAAEAAKSNSVVGSGDIWDVLDPRRATIRRQRFLLHVLCNATRGLDFMHRCSILHQSLGPESIVLSNVNEGDISGMSVQITDLGFAVDASERALSNETTREEVWNESNDRAHQSERHPAGNDLWLRANAAGAWSTYEMRNFGLADDILSLGLLFLYSMLSALSAESIMDGPQLYRLVQTTFDSDLGPFRDYCLEDERLEDAIALLDKRNRAGWELIQAMIQQDWKSRPTAASCLNHAFFNRSLLDSEV